MLCAGRRRLSFVRLFFGTVFSSQKGSSGRAFSLTVAASCVRRGRARGPARVRACDQKTGAGQAHAGGNGREGGGRRKRVQGHCTDGASACSVREGRARRQRANVRFQRTGRARELAQVSRESGRPLRLSTACSKRSSPIPLPHGSHTAPQKRSPRLRRLRRLRRHVRTLSYLFEVGDGLLHPRHVLLNRFQSVSTRDAPPRRGMRTAPTHPHPPISVQSPLSLSLFSSRRRVPCSALAVCLMSLRRHEHGAHWLRRHRRWNRLRRHVRRQQLLPQHVRSPPAHLHARESASRIRVESRSIPGRIQRIQRRFSSQAQAAQGSRAERRTHRRLAPVAVDKGRPRLRRQQTRHRQKLLHRLGHADEDAKCSGRLADMRL